MQLLQAEMVDGDAFALGQLDGLARGHMGLSEGHLRGEGDRERGLSSAPLQPHKPQLQLSPGTYSLPNQVQSQVSSQHLRAQRPLHVLLVDLQEEEPRDTLPSAPPWGSGVLRVRGIHLEL